MVGAMMRGHQGFQVRQVGHQLGRASQRRFALPLHVAKGFHRVGEIGAQAAAHMIGNGALHDQQRDRGQAGGGQQHGDEKLRPQP